MVCLVEDVCLISRKSCQRSPDLLLGTIRYWVLNCITDIKSDISCTESKIFCIHEGLDGVY